MSDESDEPEEPKKWHIKGHLDAELVVTPALPPDFHISFSTHDTTDGESTIIKLKMGTQATPKIILYTSYICPWAHRAQIALAELDLDFEEVHIDLKVPRTPEYLAINPRGLVPALSYNGEILVESGIICQFLADAHPSHLQKTSREEGGALERAKHTFFIDTYFSKVKPIFDRSLNLKTNEERVNAGNELVDAVVKQLEPLLKDAAPFFGGSEKMTFVEVQCASFLLRLLTYPKYEELAPKSILTGLEEKAPAFWKWANAATKEKSVTYVWRDDLEKKIVETQVRRYKANRAA